MVECLKKFSLEIVRNLITSNADVGKYFKKNWVTLKDNSVFSFYLFVHYCLIKIGGNWCLPKLV